MLDNNYTFHMFRKKSLLHIIRLLAEPVDVQYSGVTNHCDNEGTLQGFGDVLISNNSLTNILSLVLVHDNYDVLYENTVDFFTIHTQNN